MAACTITTLQADACTNGFYAVAQNEGQWRAIVLQLLYSASSSSDTIAELTEDACTNGFYAVATNEEQWEAAVLQLLCNIGG